MARIAMIVGNPCSPDYRVIKEAEALAGLGHEVRVFCVAKVGVPDLESMIKFVAGLDEERVARISRRRDQMRGQSCLGGAHRPDMQVVDRGDAWQAA